MDAVANGMKWMTGGVDDLNCCYINIIIVVRKGGGPELLYLSAFQFFLTHFDARCNLFLYVVGMDGMGQKEEE